MRKGRRKFLRRLFLQLCKTVGNQSTAPERIRGVLQEVFRKMLYFQIHFIVSILIQTPFAFLQNNFLFFA
jgi:hypothetical protein